MRAKTRAHSRWNCAIRIAGIHGLKRNSLAIFSFYDAFLFAHDFHFGFNAHSCTWPLKKAHWAPFLAGKSQPIKSRAITLGNYARFDFRIEFHNENERETPPTLSWLIGGGFPKYGSSSVSYFSSPRLFPIGTDLMQKYPCLKLETAPSNISFPSHKNRISR